MTPQGPLPSDEKKVYNTGNPETDKFLNSLDEKYKQQLTVKNLTYQDLIKNAEKLKGWYFIYQESAVTFLRESKVENGYLSFIVWIYSDYDHKTIAPVIFQMPENNWIKERKNEASTYTYSFNKATMQGDVITIVTEPTTKTVMDVVDEAGTVKKMPVLKIVGIADKYGVWEESQK
jgi:hypothetical protein